MEAIRRHSPSFYNEHHEGTVSLYSKQKAYSGDVTASLLRLSLNQFTEVEAQHAYIYEQDEDQMDVNAVERQLLNLENLKEVNMVIWRGDNSADDSSQQGEDCREELPWYYFIRVSPDQLEPDDINPSYTTTDNFQIHAWILADGEMGTSVTKNRSLEYLPLGKDNVELVAQHLDDYLEDFLEQNIGNHLWVYVGMPEFKDTELLDVMSLQLNQIRASLTDFGDELSVTVDVINWVDWVKLG